MEKLESLKQHQKDVQYIVNELLTRSCPQEIKSYSHLMRPKNYVTRAPKLSDRKLNRVLYLDRERQVLGVEPYVTQEALAQATLSEGFVPPVVAEFKKITVSGAIMGASLESSSHAQGQFNDMALSYELLLGKGETLQVSKEQNSDLFWGVSGSYGTFARLLSAEIPLLPAKKFVSVEIKSFSSVDTFVEALKKLCKEKTPPEYIEGLVFAHNDCKIIAASLTDERGGPLYTQSPSSLWFHQKIAKEDASFQMPLYDYLFRYDRGAFWMGTYALWPELLLRFWFEDMSWMPKKALHWLKSTPVGKYNTPRYPNPLFRTVTSPLMDSQTLYRLLHSRRENWFERHFVVQDFYLPEDKTAEFIKYSLNTNDIKPLWICPCKATSKAQLFSPQAQGGDLLFDVGVYGWPKEPLKGPEASRLLETKTYQLGGKKMFYSWNFMSEEELWQHYSKIEHDALRDKYGATGVFPSFPEKVLPI